MAWVAGAAGLALYNWWVLVPFRPGLLRSPNELFSDLEMPGQPFASAMQHADLLSGLLLMVAFLAVAGAGARACWGEWAGMMVSAAAGSAGGVLPESCADGINAVCRQRELSFSLTPYDYIHAVAGICELAGVTVALVLAYRRTRGDRTGAARTGPANTQRSTALCRAFAQVAQVFGTLKSGSALDRQLVRAFSG